MAEMSSGLLRQRRNLMALSIGLLVFELGQGKFEKLSFPAVGVYLDNPEVGIWLAWIAEFYFLWRYWLYAGEARRRYELDRIAIFARNSAFRKIAQRRLYEEHNIEFRLPQPAVERKIFRREFDYSTFPFGKSSREVNDLKGKKASVSFFALLPIELHATIKTIATTSSFTDYFLPYIIALFTFLVAAINHWPF